MLRASVESEFHRSLLKLCSEMDMPIEGLHTETGPGVLEAAILYTDALAAADRAVLFKTFSKIWAERQGKMLTFMAKWSNAYPGQSGHLHLSLRDKARQSGILPERASGQHVRDHALVCRRPAGFAAGAACDGRFHREQLFAFGAGLLGADGCDLGNRESHLCPAGHSRQAGEPACGISGRCRRHQSVPCNRCGAGIGALGDRAQNRTEQPIAGNAYERTNPPKRAFPRTLSEAAERLTASQAARNLFGDVFVDHYAMTRQWEEREFRKAITDWELARYFEII